MIKISSFRRRTLGLLVTTTLAGGCDKVDLSGLALIDSSGNLDLHLADNVTYTEDNYGENIEYRQIAIRLDPKALGAEDWQLTAIGIDPNSAFALSRDYRETEIGFKTDLAPIPSNIGVVMPIIPEYVREDIRNFFTEYKITLYGARSNELPDGFSSKCNADETEELMNYCENEGLFCYMATGAGVEFLFLPTQRSNDATLAGKLMRMFCDDKFYFDTVLLKEKKTFEGDDDLESIEKATLERRRISEERLQVILEEHNDNIIFNGH